MGSDPCRVQPSDREPLARCHGRYGYLYLIDPAGSEAARDIPEHGADRMKDIHEINISLSFLQEYIWIIADVGRFL